MWDWLLLPGAAGFMALPLGFLVRRWWVVAVAALPSICWLALTLSTWTEPDADGATGADWFMGGFLLVGLPIILGAALGVLLGRQIFPPRRRPTTG